MHFTHTEIVAHADGSQAAISTTYTGFDAFHMKSAAAIRRSPISYFAAVVSPVGVAIGALTQHQMEILALDIVPLLCLLLMFVCGPSEDIVGA